MVDFDHRTKRSDFQLFLSNVYEMKDDFTKEFRNLGMKEYSEFFKIFTHKNCY